MKTIILNKLLILEFFEKFDSVQSFYYFSNFAFSQDTHNEKEQWIPLLNLNRTAMYISTNIFFEI